jgi:hypothetical protein
VAYGGAAMLKIPWETTVSLALVASYLGPYTIDVIFVKWADWKFGKRPTDAAN